MELSFFYFGHLIIQLTSSEVNAESQIAKQTPYAASLSR